jgi:hypothetical protein
MLKVKAAIGIAFLLLTASPGVATGAMLDAIISDVTTRAFSVVWASDRPVSWDEISVRVFESDDAGNRGDEITDTLTVSVLATEHALANGVVKVDVVGLLADRLYYVTAHSDHADGESFVLPESGPGLRVRTAALTTKVGASNAPIVNDLILYQLPEPVDATDGTLLVVSVAGVSRYPVSAFFGSDVESAAIIDLNNVYDADGASAEVAAGDVLDVTWYRGRKCPEIVHHRERTFRRAPAPPDEVPITSLEVPDFCHFADTFCDGVIDISDIQRVVSVLNAVEGSCRFNPELDVFADGFIDISDIQRIVTRLGRTEPFED